MTTERGTRLGRTNGKLFCCEADGGSLFDVKIYREGNSWFTDTGRLLKTFLTEMFHESSNVKFARAVIPAQNRIVWFRLVNGTAKATYEEPLERPDVPDTRRSTAKATYTKPNLGAQS
jgi:hypothetical protein